MIKGRRKWSGDAIRQTSFGIVPGEESFMGMEIVWSRSSLSPSLQVVGQIVCCLAAGLSDPKSAIKLIGIS